MIHTQNLHLIACQPSYLVALEKSKTDLGNLLNVTIAKGWPQFEAAYKPLEAGTPDLEKYNWGTILFILEKESCLIGSGGFKGQPDSLGVVEFGYEIAPEYWNLGYTTEACKAMRDFAFEQETVHQLIAHTLSEENASNRVLKKIGMHFDSELPDKKLGKIWRWKLEKNKS